MKNKIKKLINLLKRDELFILPASLTYYFVLALMPILTLIVLIASSFNISIENIIILIEDILPNKISSSIIDIVSGKGFDTNIGLFNIIAFILATNGTYAIIRTANNLYKVKDSEPIKDRIKSVIVLVNILLLMLFLILVPVFGEKILLLIQNIEVISSITDELVFVLNLIKWPITFLILFFNIKLIYTVSPSKQLQSKNTTLGSLITTILWIVSSIIFGYYIDYLANYDILYGNLSSIIMLMIWLYVLSFVFVLGMIINTAYYKENEEKNSEKE